MGGGSIVSLRGKKSRLISGPLTQGSELVFDKVLAVGKEGKLHIGAPIIDGAVVKAEVLGLSQGEKIYVQKFRRRKNYRRRTGHRSVSTKVRISEIPAVE
jgi:large subunit ribosomal protein L21